MVNERSASSSMTATRAGRDLGRLIGMLDDFTLDEVDNHLADIRRAVRHPLEVLAHECQTDRAGNVTRVLEHVRQQLAEGLLGEKVDLVVARDYLASQRRIAP